MEYKTLEANARWAAQMRRDLYLDISAANSRHHAKGQADAQPVLRLIPCQIPRTRLGDKAMTYRLHVTGDNIDAIATPKVVADMLAYLCSHEAGATLSITRVNRQGRSCQGAEPLNVTAWLDPDAPQGVALTTPTVYATGERVKDLYAYGDIVYQFRSLDYSAGRC